MLERPLWRRVVTGANETRTWQGFARALARDLTPKSAQGAWQADNLALESEGRWRVA
jgi:hypothetical protein